MVLSDSLLPFKYPKKTFFEINVTAYLSRPKIWLTTKKAKQKALPTEATHLTYSVN